MRHNNRLILFLILLIFWGCSSIVRFSDKSDEIINTNKIKTSSNTKINQSNESGSTDLNNLEKYTTKTQKMILEVAEDWIGTPYKYGGIDKNGIDCSGFTYIVFLTVGKVLPRTAEQQYLYTKRISIKELDVGDLIFFARKGKISHVGIYSGNNTMIHASSSNGVIRQSLDSYNGMTIAGYGRP